MTLVKICGITSLEDARAAVEAGAGALGFNFWRPGRRYVAPDRAAEIIAELPAQVWKVGVFVNEAAGTVAAIAREAGLTALQFHGAEPPEYVEAFAAYTRVKAFRVDDAFRPEAISRYRAEAFLLDGAGQTPGGTGAAFDWERAIDAKRFGRIILAGGLTPENAGEAVRRVAPWGVDVAGGVESAPGRKDRERVRRFVRAVREAEKA